MKKIMTMGIALLSTLLFVGCSSEEEPAVDAEAKYQVVRTTDVDVPPPMPSFPTMTDQVTLSIVAESENHVSITLPETTTNYNGMAMTIPSFTIKNNPVESDTDGDVVIPRYEFNMIEANKEIKGSIQGEVEADGDLELEVRFTYGKMQLDIIQKFETPDRD